MSTWAVNFHQNLEPLSLKIFKTLCNQKHLNIIRNRVIISSSDWPDLSLVSPSCLVKNNPCYKLVIYFLTWPLNLFMSRTRSVSASFMVSWNKHTLDKLHLWMMIWHLIGCLWQQPSFKCGMLLIESESKPQRHETLQSVFFCQVLGQGCCHRW